MKLRYELVSTVIDAVRHNRYVRHQPCLALLSTGGDERLRETESARTCLTNLIARRVSSESRNDDCVDVYGLAPRVAEERHRACGAFHHLKPRSLQPGRETFEVGGRLHRRIVAPKARRRSSDPSAERQIWRGGASAGSTIGRGREHAGLGMSGLPAALAFGFGCDAA